MPQVLSNFDMNNQSQAKNALDSIDAKDYVTQDEIPQSVIPTSFLSYDTASFNINPTALTPMPIFETLDPNNVGTAVTKISDTQIRIEETGSYFGFINIAMQSNVPRAAPVFFVYVNGSLISQGAIAWNSSYIRSNSNHNESSTSGTFRLTLNQNDLLEIRSQADAATGTVTPRGANACQFCLYQMPAQAIKGEKGDKGDPGPSQFFAGNGVPNPALGDVGDYYKDNLTSDYYTKTGSSTWTLQGNDKGTAAARRTYWAERNGNVSTGSNFAFGNGAQNSEGVPVFESGEIDKVGFKSNSGYTSITIGVLINGVTTITANFTPSTVVQTLATPVPVAEGDSIAFEVVAVSGNTGICVASCQVVDV